jgi:putative flippase GtrA
MVGVANTAIDFLVFTALNSLGVNYALSQALGYGCGVANSYIFNKKWTFQDKNTGKKNIGELVKFVSVNLITLAATTMLIKLLVNNLGLNVYLGKIIVTVAAQIINFLSYKLWVFQPGGNHAQKQN